MKAKWKKAPPELIAMFDAAIAGKPGVERRQMFGYPCAFLKGNMLAGLFEDQMMVRLSETDRTKASQQVAATPFAPGGRPMREYVVLPAEIVADKRRLGAWLKRAIAYVETLPAKKPRKSRRG
jgi:TfoX/Sxy family transcriptional regulator of competence genes